MRFALWCFRRIRRVLRRRLGETVYAVVPDPPDAPRPRTLYLVGETVPWCGVLVCPCGCGDAIRLSLVPRDHPSWNAVIGDADRPTLSPSIHRVVGCRSHFFLRGGRIVWADPTPRSRRNRER
jgi:hypothetical protein